MTGLLWLEDARLTALALSQSPAWLWSPDATRVVWANPVGAAMLGAPTPAALTVRPFERLEAVAAEVARLIETLKPDGAVRLERLRGFGTAMGCPLTCACSRITIADGSSPVLIVAIERSGPLLSLTERVSRLLAACLEPVAMFDDDGGLLGATPAARQRIGASTSLEMLGPPALIAAARNHGHAAGEGATGAISIDRIRDQAVWVVAFGRSRLRRDPVIAPDERPARQIPTPAQELPAKSLEAMLAPRAPPDTEQSELFPDLPPLSPEPTSTLTDERRHPLRFVWQMDRDGRFTIDSPEFMTMIGPRAAALLGQPWSFMASVMNLDPSGQVARAVATRGTWSGVSVLWRVDDFGERLTVELSGLPVFDRDRTYRGYRGFGVCRDLALLNAIARVRSGAAAPDSGDAPSIEIAPPTAPGLTPVERYAFDEISRELTTRINQADIHALRAANANAPVIEYQAPEYPDAPPSDEPAEPEPRDADNARPFLDRLPIGVLVYRLSHLLYANKAFLSWAGSATLDALVEAGGLDSLMIESGDVAIESGGRKAFAITSLNDAKSVAEARLLQVPWDGESAFALLTMPQSVDPTTQAALDVARSERDDLAAILDTATDGVVVLDRAARIVSANRSAQALFGYDAHEFEGMTFSELFAPESIGTVADHFDRLQRRGVAALLNDGGEIIGRERLGGLIPLFMTMGRLGNDGSKSCAVFRDITSWKKSEEELIAARRDAEQASSAKSNFLSRISHEIRAPLNTIIGFSEVMAEERFGPIGNHRYRQYLKDIRASGEHVISLINDLLDLSKIEAGKLELAFANLPINDLTQQCVAIMQPQANRERVIIRTSLSPRLPQVVADARSLRQIVLNLLSNSIKFTVAGGQVIVSTTATDTGEVVLRVRDTGAGMNEADIAAALEPFRQIETATGARSGGAGLGLPLTKALAEANHATFQIKSTPNEGTLIEVTFPGASLLAAQ